MINKLINDAKEHSIEYGSIPFWSWNDKLDPEELRRQIRNMRDMKMNGFFMHARGGLETEYLGDDWFKCIDACIDEAKKLNMEAWSYDENGWPSGFAGGKVLEDSKNHALYLKYELCDDIPESDNILGVYINDGDTIRLINENETAEKYHVVTLYSDPSLADSFDLRVTEEFIKYTHEEYKKRIPEGDFGGAMPGFFTDEPQYYRWGTPWSNTFPEEFEKMFGYSVFSKLPALFIDFEGSKEFEFDYYKMCHRLFIDHWIKPVYDWCEENGCRLTGHAVEENNLNGQMWCNGGIMPFYEYEHIPGIDYLGRDISDDVGSKQLGSACEQLGKKKALSEMFGCCGWDVTPLELKRIAERQYVNGVNVMCQHLYAYSMRGQRKRDYPAHYSDHLPWQGDMAEFNEYFNNLGYLLSRGQEIVNTLAIHPIHSAYLTYKRHLETKSIEKLEREFHQLSDLLSGNQISYHWGDECMMAKMAKVEGNKIKVGKCTYDYIVIPSFETIDSTTYRLIKEFIANGGKVWCFRDIPTRIDGRIADTSAIKNTCSFEDIKNAAFVKITDENGNNLPEYRVNLRDTEYGKLLYILNLSMEENLGVNILVKDAKNVIELKTADLSKIAAEGFAGENDFTIVSDFVPVESKVFLVSDEIKAEKVSDIEEKQYIKLNNNFKFKEIPENALTLDKFMVSKNGGEYSELRPLERIRDNLLRERFSGTLSLKAQFTVKDIPEELILTIEPNKGAVYEVNGEKIEVNGPWKMDRLFKTADISKYVKEGVNEIVVTLPYYQRDYVYYVLYGGVSESLRNCLVFDTEIECMYLFGKFKVNTPGVFVKSVKDSHIYFSDRFIIEKAEENIDVRNIVTNGYPFFTGKVSVTTKLNYKSGDPTCLKLKGRFAIAKVEVNGKEADTLMFKYETDLKDYLTEGENEIVITLINSNRNLLGVHHCYDPEPYGVGPGTFSMENQWKDEICLGYFNRYSFIRFGFDI